jgi:phosphopantothenoylcysteine decarboxylase/phosphopantothenate--cysteine ligase
MSGETQSLRCLVTAGPTREFFDPVRFISNPSSGKMGYALAAEAARLGWAVDLVSGPVALADPEGVRVTRVVTGEEMYDACRSLFAQCHLLIMTAAVCDFRPKQRFEQKQKKDACPAMIAFEPVRDILKTLAAGKQPWQRVAGFAAETEHLEIHAQAKLEAKRLDWIVANTVGGPDSAFESDTNRVCLMGRDGSRIRMGPADKRAVAAALMRYWHDAICPA